MYSDAVSGWAGWALAHLEFVYPIPIRGADHAHHITARPPGYEILTASLIMYIIIKFFHLPLLSDKIKYTCF